MIKNIDLNNVKKEIKKLVGNDLIDIISEEQGKFGSDSEIKDYLE